MSAKPNPVDGAIVRGDGQLEPMKVMESGANAEMSLDPDASTPIALAMTGGRQITAARRPAVASE